MELSKRILSSLILLPITITIIVIGNIYFKLLLIFLFLISIKEFYHITINKFVFITSVCFTIISFVTIYNLRNHFHSNNLNLFYFFFILNICIATDIGGYLIGNIIKGPKLTKISPNKTISGSIGAIIFSIIISKLYLNNIYLFLDNSFSYDIKIYLIILFISCVSQIGDIIVSSLKRTSKKKDTGNLIPGHGGLLDRIDGMIFAFPFSYILILFNLL